MQLSDTRTIHAAPETVWAAILNADVLKVCVPGCESLTGSPEQGFEAVVVQKVGPVSARFTGIVTLTDMVEGREVTLTGEGKGGAAGFAKGSARMTLAPEGDATLLTYTVTANVGGKIAQLGGRIIDAFAKRLADQFFQRFQDAVEGPDAGSDDAATTTDGSTEASGDGPKKGWFGRMFNKD